ncbi:glycosyltransferase family 4 protein [[Eubacterium] hominis]|uniref:glycosyltransferase family 4 protein n=1 Tax=[Eubacterium] hominis TaxID=2764325 RepID=UPI003A4E5F61
MKILWVTAQVLPLVADDLNLPKLGFGGWIMNMLNQLEEIDEIELGVAMVSTKIDKIFEKQSGKIKCFVAPDEGNKSINNHYRDEIIKRFKPDIIHIEGNEFPIQNKFSNIKDIPTLVSLQGILSGCEPYQYGEIPIVDYLFSFKNKNIISSWILYFRKHLLFDKRINLETQTIKNAKYLMGRTFWDRAHSYWINSTSKYYKCNRILRPSFYEQEWDGNDCQKYTIFIGNGYSPLKGLHFILKAISLLKKEFPDVKVYVAGQCPIVKSKKLSFHKFGYSRYIRRIIENDNLGDNVFFTGVLQEHEMLDRMKKSNVYVLPSLIENSPNTLGEAMILGMPCISAYTGGASEMAINEKECLFYRANDFKLLAWQIRRLFKDENMAKELGIKARKHAMNTHDPITNRNALLDAYEDIIQSNRK